MPMYEYKCADCGKDFEELVPMNERKNPPCPACGSMKTEKKMSAFGGLHAGSGSSCGSSGFS